MSNKWIIIGESMDLGRYCDRCDGYDNEEEIATFDSEKDAKNYLNWARLKNESGFGYSKRVFRQKSLLFHCSDARIEKYFIPVYLPPQHNPEKK